MKTGRGAGRGRWGALTLVFAAVVAGAAAAPAAAFQRQSDEDCRCVDRDGNAVADCTCLRVPRMEMSTVMARLGRPRLGISVAADQGSQVDAQGARVTDVLEDGPAWNAGIREGDVITSVDGHSLFDALPTDAEEDFDLDRSIPVQRLLAIARDLEPGQEVEVAFLREGQRRTVTVSAEDLAGRGFGLAVPPFDAERFREQMRELQNLGEIEGLRRFQWRSGEPQGLDLQFFGGGPTMGRYGLHLVPLNEGLGQYFGTSAGVLVVEVAEGSALGLRAGDVIVSVGGREATTPERVGSLLATYDEGEDVQIRLRRNGREVEVMGRLERQER